ncbi:cytoskeletal protein RodZ [Mycobacterium sp. OTB74]|nr:cytoskeletal protein RodZ [Mycobacterium sp. OTB74]
MACSQAKDAASHASSVASSAASAGASVASSAASAGASVASSAASAGASAATSAASAASSAVSSAIAGAATSLNVPGVGNVNLDGPTNDAYTKAGGEAALGLPTAQPEKVGDGTVQPFAKGTIYSSPATGAHVVQGEILKVYNAQGGPGGSLGYPTADEAQTAGGPDVAKGGWVSEFQKGTITWLNQGDGTFKETVTPKA